MSDERKDISVNDAQFDHPVDRVQTDNSVVSFESGVGSSRQQELDESEEMRRN